MAQHGSYAGSVATRGRACGDTREQGGIYAEIARSPRGKQIEEFLLDPPIVVAEVVDLPRRGVRIIAQYDKDGKSTGIFHIADRIGKESYPYPVEWIEETRHMGGSRKLPPTLDFSKLSGDSRLLVAHDYAHVENFIDYYATKRTILCPRTFKEHYTIFDHANQTGKVVTSMCVGIYWNDGDPDTFDQSDDGVEWDSDTVAGALKTIGQAIYMSKPRPSNVTPAYKLAFFASLPIDRLVVVRGNNHEAALQRAKAANMMVAEVDE